MSKSKFDQLKDFLMNLGSEEPKQEEVEAKQELAEEVKEEAKEEVKQEEVSYVLRADFDSFKSEMLSMFKTLMEENKKDLKEVPEKLSKVEETEEEVKEEVKEVELSKEVEEIVHSPENEVEKKEVQLSKPLWAMTTLERLQNKLNG